MFFRRSQPLLQWKPNYFRSATKPPNRKSSFETYDVQFARTLESVRAVVLMNIDSQGYLNYTATSPDSPVRMRITFSRFDTKILPSPILPVRAPATIASMAD